MNEADPKPLKPGESEARATSAGKKAGDPVIATAIGRQLKSLYDGVLTEPVPDALADLVKRLAAKADKQT